MLNDSTIRRLPTKKDGKEMALQERHIVKESTNPNTKSSNAGDEVWKNTGNYFTKMDEALKFYCQIEMREASSLENLIEIINGLNDKIDILLSIKTD